MTKTMTIYRDTETGNIHGDPDGPSLGISSRLTEAEQIDAYAEEYLGWDPDRGSIEDDTGCTIRVESFFGSERI